MPFEYDAPSLPTFFDFGTASGLVTALAPMIAMSLGFWGVVQVGKWVKRSIQSSLPWYDPKKYDTDREWRRVMKGHVQVTRSLQRRERRASRQAKGSRRRGRYAA